MTAAATTRENEDADPVGTPVPASVRHAMPAAPVSPPPTPAEPRKPRALDQEKEDFTSEGAPPPGKVATEEPALPAKGGAGAPRR